MFGEWIKAVHTQKEIRGKKEKGFLLLAILRRGRQDGYWHMGKAVQDTPKS